MKQSDYLLPKKTLGRIKVAETLLAICKAQTRNTDPAVALAYSEHCYDLQIRLAELRSNRPDFPTDHPEAAVAGPPR